MKQLKEIQFGAALFGGYSPEIRMIEAENSSRKNHEAAKCHPRVCLLVVRGVAIVTDVNNRNKYHSNTHGERL